MALFSTVPVSGKHIAIKGTFFGARGGSCSCNPCDCNPCRCGNSLVPEPPLWRVSGVFIEAGHAGDLNLSHQVLLSLALPDEAGKWEEFLFAHHAATPEQIASLLEIFEEELDSLPAEIGPQPRSRRAVYRAPFTYLADATRPFLRATLTQDQLTLMRPGAQQESAWPREWIYDGPMALRGAIEEHR